MKTNLKNILFLATFVVTSAVSSISPLAAESFSDKVSEYFNEFPYIGLISDEISYGPITISNVHINHADKLALASPGEVLHGSLKYRINSDKSDVDFHHLLVGIKGIGPQECVSHSLDIWDSKGKAYFTLTAPSTPGVYEVRFLYADGLTCQQAKDSWILGQDVPSSDATIGVIIVK